MPSVLITGASRGLGLEFARQYQEAGWRVFAACRAPARARSLSALAGEGLSVHALDVADFAAIEALAHELAGVSLDLLLNNAGLYGREAGTFGRIDYGTWEEVVRVNTLAPIKMAEVFVEHVARSERRLMVFMSTRMASITELAEGGFYPYRSSKAGLNAAVKTLSVDLAERGIAAIAVHPGWVRTDMGGPAAPLLPAESVRALRAVIDKLGPEQTGRFFNYDGSPIPW